MLDIYKKERNILIIKSLIIQIKIEYLFDFSKRYVIIKEDRRDLNGDIDISNEYSKQQFLMLIASHIMTQQLKLRQAILTGDSYRKEQATTTLNQFKMAYIKASKF